MQIMPDINNHLFIQLGIGRSAAVNAMFLQSLDLKNKKKETSLLCRDRHYFRFVAELSHETISPFASAEEYGVRRFLKFASY